MVKKISISVIVFIATLLVAGIVMELVKTDQQEKNRYFRTRNVFQYSRENVRFDPVLGYMPKPNLDVSFNNEEYTTNVRTNKLGFRDDYNSLINPDIIFLGDSYVWGWGVDEQYSAEKQYEQLTGKNVLNAGVPGYGNVQELLLLLKLRGVTQLQGKHVVLFFCANDFIDNENTSFGVFPYFIKDAEGPDFSHPSSEGFEQWQNAVEQWTIQSPLAKRSLLWYYISTAVNNVQAKDIYRDFETTDNKVNGIQAFLLVANELATLRQQEQMKVSIVYVPPAAYYEKRMPDRSLEIVRTTCSKLNIPFLDLSPFLSGDDYYELDLHWKPSGHKKVALAIYTAK